MTIIGGLQKDFTPDPGRFSEIVGLIYDCVLDPDAWPKALGAVCGDLDLMHGVLGYYIANTGEPRLRKQYGMDPNWFDRMPEFGMEMAQFWGGPARLRAYPLGEAVVHSIAQPDFDFGSNRFAREWCSPQGVVDFVAMTVAADADGLGTLVFTSRRRLEEASEPQIAFIRALSPHVRRAVAISHVLDLQTIEAASFRATLDALPNGIVLVDSAGRVIHANAAAEARMRAREELRLTDGKVALRDAAATEALMTAVRRCADPASLGQRGIGVPTWSREGERSIVHVLPLSGGKLRGSLGPAAAAALFIASAHAHAHVPADALALLYNLTPAEARICESIAEGRKLSEIARQIGVATSTVRTHLLRIFDKTGVNRQTDLVRLVDSLALPAA